MFYVEDDFFEKAHIDIVDSAINRIQDDSRTVFLKNGQKVEYSRILLASGSVKQKLNKAFGNVIAIDDFESHA